MLLGFQLGYNSALLRACQSGPLSAFQSVCVSAVALGCEWTLWGVATVMRLVLPSAVSSVLPSDEALVALLGLPSA